MNNRPLLRGMGAEHAPRAAHPIDVAFSTVPEESMVRFHFFPSHDHGNGTFWQRVASGLLRETRVPFERLEVYGGHGVYITAVTLPKNKRRVLVQESSPFFSIEVCPHILGENCECCGLPPVEEIETPRKRKNWNRRKQKRLRRTSKP